MKIGIDGRFWNESGVGRYIRNLVRELQLIDSDNRYVLFVHPKVKAEELPQNKNWQVVRTDIRWHTLSEQREFPPLLHSFNLDLVHFPYFSVPVFYNKPMVVTIHDLILHHFSTGKATTLPKPVYHLKRFGYMFVMKQAAVKASRIITVSHATKREIIDHLNIPKEKIVVTYEGADDALRRSETKPLTEAYFLYVGNAYPHKNLRKLFFAFSSIHDTKVKLVVAGRDDYFMKEMRKEARTGYRNPNIVFVVNATDEELSQLYSHALALVSPSLMEGFGLPLVEAMKLGCLVIASDIPSSHEVCENAAVYFNPNDRKELTKYLNDVIHNPHTFDEIRRRGKLRASAFSWKNMAKETLAVYENCLQ